MGKNAWGFALVAVFMAVGAVAQAPSPSSSSSSDCISAITTLSPCLSFAATNSNQTKPGNDCCTAFSSVVSTKAICLCQLISGNNSLELPINRTKALTLPGACNVKTPPVSECADGLSKAVVPLARGTWEISEHREEEASEVYHRPFIKDDNCE